MIDEEIKKVKFSEKSSKIPKGLKGFYLFSISISRGYISLPFDLSKSYN